MYPREINANYIFIGTPLYEGNIQNIVDKACGEAEIYLKNRVHGILIENMHDIPYIQANHFGPEIVAMMTRISCEIKKVAHIPCGIQVLSCGNKEALAIAQACSLDFIRAEGFVFAHIADEGYTNANAGDLLRYRKNIKADNVLIFTDIKKKHSSHAITADLTLRETAKAAEYFLSDGLIITGFATGEETSVADLKEVKTYSSLPIIVGSGVNLNNFHDYSSCDAVIVGSYFKEQGKWYNNLDIKRVSHFMRNINSQ